MSELHLKTTLSLKPINNQIINCECVSIHLSILLFMGNYVFLVHFNILVFKLVAEKDSETERPYIVCSPRLCLTLLHLSYRYYIKESKGSKRWLIFLEGELPVFGKLCVF